MKKIAFLIILSLFLLASFPYQTTAIERVTLGVLPFEITDCPPSTYRQVIMDNLKEELELSGYIDVLDEPAIRDRIDKSFERLLEYRTVELLSEVGEAADVPKMLIGSIACRLEDIGKNEKEEMLHVTFTLIDVPGREVQKKFKVVFPFEKFFNLGIKHMAYIIRGELPLTGSIVQMRNLIGIIDLGLHHGLNNGDRLIVYNKKVPITDLRNRILGFEEEAVGFVRIVEIHEEWSKVRLETSTKVDHHRISNDPEIGYIKRLHEGYKVRTYVDRDLLLNAKKKSGAKTTETKTRKPVHWR